jgi:hypothetical protein
VGVQPLPRRFNVAITRAQTKMVVVGSPGFFAFVPAADGVAELAGLAALKRWYLDRLDRRQVEWVPGHQDDA